MLPEGVLSIVIRADYWQPQKNERKSRIDQILASACCPRQNEHIDIKRVAYNHVAAILQRCQKGRKSVVFTVRCYASAVLAMVLCLSVCPSQVGVLLKQRNVGSHKQHHTIVQGL